MTLDVELLNESTSILPRTSYTFKITYDGSTPSREAVKTKMQLHVDDDKDHLIVRNFPAKQAGNTFTVEARQYHDEAAKELLEHDSMLDKNRFDDEAEEEDE